MKDVMIESHGMAVLRFQVYAWNTFFLQPKYVNYKVLLMSFVLCYVWYLEYF